LGFGVWGWGFGGWGIGPNPQSPIPNPHKKTLIQNKLFHLLVKKQIKLVFKLFKKYY